MPDLSVIVITYNEERNIERCLESVRWADEIIVVDSFSRDRTIEIARRFTEKIIQHEYGGDIPQRERGFATAKGDWLLYIDADEEVTPDLRDAIVKAATSDSTKDGFYVLRKVQILGQWVFHGGWYPDYTFRLFRKDRYRAEHAEVHGGFTVDGEKGTLAGCLLHYTYDSIEQYLDKMNAYTSLAVSNKLKDNPQLRASPLRLVSSPLSHLLRKFFSNKGYKDGTLGFVLACLNAIYTLALYSKVWEYRWRQREGKGVFPPITNKELSAIHRI
jgi:glycosyltransferase involved in cell wall biosynthesis